MDEFLKTILVGMGHRNTIAKYAAGMDRYVGLLIALAAAFLGMAIFMPIATVENYRGFTGTFSILDAVKILFSNQDMTGMIVVLLAAILWPVLSLSIAFDLWYKHPVQEAKFLKNAPRIRFFGRIWFILALLAVGFIYLVQFEANGKVHLPVYFLLLSVILQKLCLTRMQGLLDRIQFQEVSEDE